MSATTATFPDGVLLFGGLVKLDGVQALAGDLLGALDEGVESGFADQVRQAADHAAGALVQVGAELAEGAGPMRGQAQGVFQGRDECLPCLLVGGGVVLERPGGGEAVASGDLAAAASGEQAGSLDFDSGQDEGRRDAFGQVLDLVGCFGADPGGARGLAVLPDAVMLVTASPGSGSWRWPVGRGRVAAGGGCCR